MADSKQTDENVDEADLGWFDRTSSKRLLWRLLWGICILSVVAEVVIYFTKWQRHKHFDFDGFWGYYGLFGFVACAGSIGLAKFFGKWLKAPEDYYDDK